MSMRIASVSTTVVGQPIRDFTAGKPLYVTFGVRSVILPITNTSVGYFIALSSTGSRSSRDTEISLDTRSANIGRYLPILADRVSNFDVRQSLRISASLSATCTATATNLRNVSDRDSIALFSNLPVTGTMREVEGEGQGSQ